MKILLAAFLLSLGAASATAQEPMRFEQRIGEALPLAAPLVDETGHGIPFGSCFQGRPVVLIFGYFKCPQLCSVLARNVIDMLRDLGPSVGRDFDLVYVSIDPTDEPADARQERAAAAASYGRGHSLSGWHYLTGSGAQTAAIAKAAGFEYRYDPASRQYAHPSGFLVITPGGTISRYFPGIDFAAGEVAAAIRRAGEGRIGESVYNLILECFRGSRAASPNARRAWIALEWSVALTLIVVFGGIGWMLREEFKSRRGKEA